MLCTIFRKLVTIDQLVAKRIPAFEAYSISLVQLIWLPSGKLSATTTSVEERIEPGAQFDELLDFAVPSDKRIKVDAAVRADVVNLLLSRRWGGKIYVVTSGEFFGRTFGSFLEESSRRSPYTPWYAHQPGYEDQSEDDEQTRNSVHR